MDKEKIYPIIENTLEQIFETYKQLLKILKEKKFKMESYSLKRFIGKNQKLIDRVQTYEKLLQNTLGKVKKISDTESVYQAILDIYPHKKSFLEEKFRNLALLIEDIQQEQKGIEDILLAAKEKISRDLQANKNKNLINNKYKMPKNVIRGKFVNKKTQNWHFDKKSGKFVLWIVDCDQFPGFSEPKTAFFELLGFEKGGVCIFIIFHQV